MKATVLILSKTHMNNGHACVGGITLDGRYVRLLNQNEENQSEDTDLEPRQAWEIKFSERNNNVAPHVEDIIVHSRESKGKLKDNITIKDFIIKRNSIIHPFSRLDLVLIKRVIIQPVGLNSIRFNKYQRCIIVRGRMGACQ